MAGETFGRVVLVVAKEFGLQAAALTPDTDIHKDTSKFDAMGVTDMGLVLSLEEEFDIALADHVVEPFMTKLKGPFEPESTYPAFRISDMVELVEQALTAEAA